MIVNPSAHSDRHALAAVKALQELARGGSGRIPGARPSLPGQGHAPVSRDADPEDDEGAFRAYVYTPVGSSRRAA